MYDEILFYGISIPRRIGGGGGGVVSWYVPLARADLDYYMFFVGLRYPVLA